MSKNSFLARFGDDGHIDHALEHGGYIDDSMLNPNFSEKHIHNTIHGSWELLTKADAIKNPNASHKNLMDAIDIRHYPENLDKPWSNLIINNVMEHPNVKPDHIDKIIQHDNRHALYHAMATDQNKKFNSEHLEKLSTHPNPDIRYLVTDHYNTPDHVLSNMASQDHDGFIRAMANKRLRTGK